MYRLVIQVAASRRDLHGKFLMLRKPETINFWVGRLPHWEVEDGRYFVTIHLAGAIPKAGREQIRRASEELRLAADRVTTSDQRRLQLHRKIFQQMERWLDRSEFHPYLNRPEIASVVMDAIDHRCATGIWEMNEFVVMPNHVHLFFCLLGGGLKLVLEDFKQWTGRAAGKQLDLDGDRFWQREWFDHWSRSDEEDERIVRYIQQNPVKAGLVNDYRDWKWRKR